MNIFSILVGAVMSLTAVANIAMAQLDYEWKYYRPGNTGVMGDYSDALWIDDDGLLYLGGYDPFFEEGGFSNFSKIRITLSSFSSTMPKSLASSTSITLRVFPFRLLRLLMSLWLTILSPFITKKFPSINPSAILIASAVLSLIGSETESTPASFSSTARYMTLAPVLRNASACSFNKSIEMFG